MKSTTDRGYGAAHQRERKKWQRRLDQGAIIGCARCGKPISKHDTWDLGHTDDRTAWTGPECVGCNRSVGGRNGRAAQLSEAKTFDLDW